MTMQSPMRKRLSFSVLLLTAVALTALTPTAFAATCGNGQTFSNTILFNVEVTAGPCFLDNITVTGGIIVNPRGQLQLSNSTVSGRIQVLPGGELDIQAVTGRQGQLIPGSSTITGGITIDTADDLDLFNATVVGGISITGPVNATYALCGLAIIGPLTLTDSTGGFARIGISSSGPCDSGNTIVGSVTVDNSVIEDFTNNTVIGSLRCVNGGVVIASSGNTIVGSNTCF
jgi:hypothetical protein